MDDVGWVFPPFWGGEECNWAPSDSDKAWFRKEDLKSIQIWYLKNKQPTPLIFLGRNETTLKKKDISF